MHADFVALWLLALTWNAGSCYAPPSGWRFVAACSHGRHHCGLDGCPCVRCWGDDSSPRYGVDPGVTVDAYGGCFVSHFGPDV